MGKAKRKHIGNDSKDEDAKFYVLIITMNQLERNKYLAEFMKTYKGDLDKAERRARMQYIKLLIDNRWIWL